MSNTMKRVVILRGNRLFIGRMPGTGHEISYEYRSEALEAYMRIANKLSWEGRLHSCSAIDW